MPMRNMARPLLRMASVSAGKNVGMLFLGAAGQTLVFLVRASKMSPLRI